MSTSELFRDLDPKIAGPLARVTDALKAEISSQIDGIRKEVQSLTPGGAGGGSGATGLDALEELKLAAAGIDRSTKQSAILSGLLEGAGRFSSRAAFVLVRDQGETCWGSLGFEDAGPAMQGRTVQTPNGASAWSRLREGAGTVALNADDCAAFCAQFDAPPPVVGALLPLSIGDHVAGYLYADRVGDGPLNITALQLLTFVAGQALETLPVRKRSSTPALTVAEVEAGPAPAGAEPETEVEAPAVEAEPEVDAAPEPEPEAEVAAPEPEPEAEPAVVEPDEVLGAAAEAPPPFMDPAPAAEETPPVDAEPIGPEDDTLMMPLEDVPSPEVEAAPEPAMESPAPPEPEVVEAPEPQPEEEAPAEEEAPPAVDAGSTQVVPPEDVRGPGWAFTTQEVSTDAGNEALHEEARRLARLLVTEIKLYNEEQVEQGRRSGDIYRRLQEDIDRSRQIFEDRIDPTIRSENDYFRDALVRILAGGDESLLGS